MHFSSVNFISSSSWSCHRTAHNRYLFFSRAGLKNPFLKDKSRQGVSAYIIQKMICHCLVSGNAYINNCPCILDSRQSSFLLWYYFVRTSQYIRVLQKQTMLLLSHSECILKLLYGCSWKHPWQFLSFNQLCQIVGGNRTCFFFEIGPLLIKSQTFLQTIMGGVPYMRL